jgi:hypothetical protein
MADCINLREHFGRQYRVAIDRESAEGPRDRDPWLWQIRCGTKLPDGSRLHLQAIRAGGAWVTTAEAFDRFLAALTEAALSRGGATITPPCTARERQRAAERAGRELDRAGI